MKDAGSVPGLGRSPGEGHGNPLQYSFVLAIGRGMWELGCPTMDQIHAPCIGRQLLVALATLGKPILDNTMLNLSVLLLNTIRGFTMPAQTAQALLIQVTKTPMLGEMNGVLSSLISQLNINPLLTLA